MKVVNEFDRYNKERLRAIQKVDTPVAQLSNLLLRSGHQLYEVYLLPQYEDFITPRFLEGVSFNSSEELLLRYQSKIGDPTVHGYAVGIRLISDFAIGLAPNDAQFHFSLQQTEAGPVISVVFGSRLGMKAMYDHNLRPRTVEATSLDCSSDE